MSNEQKMAAIKAELLAHLEAMFVRLANGLDVSPAMRYRLEGQIELLIKLEQFEVNFLQDFCQQKLQENNLSMPPEGFWLWAQEQGRFFIPALMIEAPVFKT